MLASFLEIYQKLELEKKKARIHRQTYSGPLIRYHSVTVPLVEEVAEAEINVDGEAMDWLVEFRIISSTVWGISKFLSLPCRMLMTNVGSASWV